METIILTAPENVQGTESTTGTTEGAHRATGVVPVASGSEPVVGSPPDPEVPEKKSRRKFTVAYKLRILQEADKCEAPGEIGALLRREGLYSSHLTIWRRHRREGILQGVRPKKRGRKPKPKNPLTDRVAQLEKQNRRLQQKLKKAELIIDAQKKMSEILGITQDLDESEENS